MQAAVLNFSTPAADPRYTTTLLHFFFYKNIFYKNIEAAICEMLRIFKNKPEAEILKWI